MAAEHMVDVEVLTPEGEVFNGEARQVSTRTAVGELGILANHAPLLAALRPAELRLHVSESEIKRFAQAHGWLQVYGNHARLLVEEAIAPEDLKAAIDHTLLAECFIRPRSWSTSSQDAWSEWYWQPNGLPAREPRRPDRRTVSPQMRRPK